VTNAPETVADLGELALVDRVVDLLGGTGRGVVLGPGDDGAIVDPGGRALVLSTDSQHEGVHFRRQWISPLDLGRRALVVNVSDLGAMGAEPLWGLVAFALPMSMSLAWVEDVARGLRLAGEQYGCTIIGGDVTRVPDRTSLTVSVVGGVPSGQEPVLRGGAQAGDLCWVTGNPGRAAAGRCLLGDGYRLSQTGGGRVVKGVERDGVELAPSAGGEEALSCIGAYLRPAPPVSFGVRLAGAGVATAMIDLSDGLGIDLMRICRASRVGVEIDLTDLEGRAELQRWQAEGLGTVREWVLGGGDDYELLGASPPAEKDELQSAADDLGIALHFIGEFSASEEGCWLRTGDGREPLDVRGWDHFGGSVESE
jgi:thiamine-monophosphate kinase